jgi:hypothetical protein
MELRLGDFSLRAKYERNVVAAVVSTAEAKALAAASASANLSPHQ